jgi:peroxiredoxin
MILQAIMSILFLATYPERSVFGTVEKPITGDSLTVYVFLHDECKISQFYTPELTRLYETYGSRKVGFVGYFPNATTTAERIEAFGKDYHIAFPLRADYKKDLTRKLGITITPEVAVWDHRTEQQIYRGRIDDSYVRVGKRKTHPQQYDLVGIIEDWLTHPDPQLLVQTKAIGCFINFTD